MHWAADAEEANRIVTELVQATGATEIVKVKSMATQEIGLNEYLEEHGIAAVETDLAELIVQLGHDKPSHILVPAIHKNRTQVRDIFLAEMDDAPKDLTDEPRRSGDGRPGASAQEVPHRQGGGVRRQLRYRRHRNPLRPRVGGQRPDVPDPAADADHRHGHRETAAAHSPTSRSSCSCCRDRRPASG